MGRGIRERQKDMRSVFKSYYTVASKWPDVTQNKNLFFIKELDITHIPQRNLSTQTDLILVLALHWIICMAFNKPLAKPLGVSDPSSGKRVSGGDWRDVNRARKVMEEQTAPCRVNHRQQKTYICSENHPCDDVDSRSALWPRLPFY